MSEKRFIYEEEPYHFPIKKRIRDTQSNETCVYDLRECCELLNEQQATIHSLKEEVRLLKPTNIEQYEQIVQLQEENEQLRKDVENLQEVVAELGATLLMNGFEIEINGENLSELIDDE